MIIYFASKYIPFPAEIYIGFSKTMTTKSTTPAQEKDVVREIDPLSRNKDLAEVLGEIAEYYYIARDTYRARTYATASANVAAYPYPITSGAQARRDINRIGDSVEKDINEFIAIDQEEKLKKELREKAADEGMFIPEEEPKTITRLHELEIKYPDVNRIVKYFRSFYGIGPVTAIKFYNAGYRTLEDLWFKAPLTTAQRTGIMWREHINLRIPRAEMDLINETIGNILNKYGIQWIITGSYRRQEPSSGDIDILVQSRSDLNMDGLISLLQPYLPATLAQGPKLYMGIFRLDENHNGHRIDIKFIDPASYPAALLHFTGSQRFNILMRQRAIDLGYTLNEYGLYDTYGNPQLLTSEEDIFRLLGVKYYPPEARTKTLNYLELI